MTELAEFALGASAPLLERALEDWTSGGKVARMWASDPTLWADEDEARWTGWMQAVEDGGGLDEDLVARLSRHIAAESLASVAVLGMGGSSLCPDVLAHTFGAGTAKHGFPSLHVFDSTVPAQVRERLGDVDVARTFFILSSKSGSTIEPNTLFAYLYARVADAVGADRAPARFAAVTDPGSSLEALAREKGFAGLAYGVPEIGGRFSALSAFGLLPGDLMGLDTADFLGRARAMAHACGADIPPAHNPGVKLGLAMASLAAAGRDKLSLVISPAIGTLGAWLEQLICESTGKLGRGIVAIGDETPGAPDVYGDDRLFVYVRLEDDPSAEQDAQVDALERAGHPVVRLRVPAQMDLGAEFFRWEIATAAAGAFLEMNPFSQPDVEAAKIAARALMEQFDETGALPDRTPVLAAEGIAVFADPALAAGGSLADALRAHLARLGSGDYFAVNAYLASTAANEEALQGLRHAVRDARRVATTLGYGPRFLHSTGQLHKGGPNTGVFLQVTQKAVDDLEVPGQRYSFGVLAAAQAQGDFEVLVERGRRALWVELDDVKTGLPRLAALVERAL